MLAVVEHLGQQHVVTGRDRRSGAHRRAEAGPARLTALDGDHEQLSAAVRSPGSTRAAEQHALQHRPRMELHDRAPMNATFAGTRPAPQVGQLAAPVAAHARADFSGQLVALQRVRADDEAEQRLVLAALQAVAPGLLLVGPAGGQLGAAIDLVVDDRAVAGRRPDDRIAMFCKTFEQLIEVISFNDLLSGL